jgi:hypothetical protein
MSLPVISVLVPTVDGREDHLNRCAAAYQAHARGEYTLDLVVVLNAPSCGWGWQRAAERMRPDSEYVHFTCDDIEPLPGWAAPAIAALDTGFHPAPRVLNGSTGAPEFFPSWGVEWPDGTDAGFSCLPFITRDLWVNSVSPMLTCHYFTDNWVSWRAGNAGYPPRVVRGYAFRHWWADHLRGAGMGYEERLAHDQELFVVAAGMAQRGLWKEPWPPSGR